MIMTVTTTVAATAITTIPITLKTTIKINITTVTATAKVMSITADSLPSHLFYYGRTTNTTVDDTNPALPIIQNIPQFPKPRAIKVMQDLYHQL